MALGKSQRQCYAKISSPLQSKGFQPSMNDYSLFRKLKGSHLTIVVVYEDDILLAGDDMSELTTFKEFLDDQFKIKDLGEVHYFLGLEIVKMPQGYLISQHKFALDFLSDIHCSAVTHVVAPLDSHVKLSAEVGDLLPDPSIYRKLAVSWKSKKQPTLALSSVEAEYMPLRLLVAEVTWVVRLLAELGVDNLS
uniref:Uncharacterized mitochondrial protein AtMg00810-like n=1 Tax=Nicotiana tabacum TaxID=4097 RepID=A0A1S4CIV8_TOBAC|nr:PREDICTED: uncharacterized mitochondrial protein AtMg00810-like [Nicotiana tabacum]